MKKLKLAKETIALIFITILSAILNLGNLGIEGTGNAYYAAAVKSMTMSLKNFFFVSFDPSGFVTIDKPPLGYWLQAISAKIAGFSGWSIILPQALAGVISVIVIYIIVKRSFGKAAGLLSALFLAVTPVFVAASRNNTVDNVLVLALLLACWALSVAAEKGKFKYLVLSMVLVGLGFNIKMLQAYMVIPALYVTYLFATAVSFKKRIVHLIAATLILVTVSLSWALIVDAIPASSRPYVDSSTNNTVMELILGHNGAERLSLSSTQDKSGGMTGGMTGGNWQGPQQSDSPTDAAGTGTTSDTTSGTTQNESVQRSTESSSSNTDDQSIDKNVQERPDGAMWDGSDGNMKGGSDGNIQGVSGGGTSGLQGSFGAQVKSSITRLFSKNILSDQIVWFILLAVFGFIASAIKEKLNFKLDSKRKQSLTLWFMWFLPVFIYFSYNTGTFHSYYLTMLAPPVAALAGIGTVSMWKLYKEGGWKSWFLPAALLVNGAMQLLMLYYFMTTSTIVKVLMVVLIILCFGSSILLAIMNLMKKGVINPNESALRFKKILVSLAVAGLLVTPLTGSAAALFTGVGSSFPAAGLELLSSTQEQQQMGGNQSGSSNSSLTSFLLANKTSSQKYLLVVSSSSDATDIIINTGESVMAIGGFLGSDNSITLEQFKALVKTGEVRYVMTGGNKSGGNESESSLTEIMNWVTENGTAVAASEYGGSSTDTSTNQMTATDNSASSDSQIASDDTGSSDSQAANDDTGSSENQAAGDASKLDGMNRDGSGGTGSGQLYDLKPYTDSLSS